MMDYAILPPEVNSGRMYTGAGSGPMVAAAAAWDRLATTLSSTATSYRRALTDLTENSWRGSASASMTAAAEPYLEWMSTTATQAEHTASQARAAAAAYETAFAATVPPPAVAANRATLAALVATNFFGQNTPAIATNQAEYAEMWAQDAAAMYNYTSSSATATALIPLTSAPQTTDPAGSSNQATAAQSAASTAAQTGSSILDWNPFGELADSPLLNNATVTGLNSFMNSVGALLLQSSGPQLLAEGVQIFLIPLMTATGKLSMLGPMAALGAATSAGLASTVSSAPGVAVATLAGSGQGVSAALGQAGSLGKLSVPAAWSAAPQDVRLTGAALPAAAAAGAPPIGPVPPLMGGPIGGMVNAPQSRETRARPGAGNPSRTAMVEGAQSAESRWTHGVAPTPTGLSDREENELEQLRDQMSDLAMECDAVARLMREAMH